MFEKEQDEIVKKFNKLCSETYEDLKIKVNAKIRDKYITEEVVNETYKIASRDKEKILNHSEPEAWLFLAAINVHKNMMRKNSRIRNNEMELMEDFISEFSESNDAVDIAEEILSDLPEKDRELLEMQFYHDLSLKEISDMKGVSYDSLQRRNHRLKEKIRNKYIK